MLDSKQPYKQAGFRSGFTTMDHIRTAKVTETKNGYRKPLCLVYIVYGTAFTSVETVALLNA